MENAMELPWEDALLERKLESDQKDFLKTFVAFANSVRPGHIAVVLIGEKDDGSVQGVTNPDEMQKKVRRECERIYPDIVWRSLVYEENGKHCVRIEIGHSGNTPHFGEGAWIRRGSETVRASQEMFQRLIDLRSSMVHELAQWVGRDIYVAGDEGSVSLQERSMVGHPRWPGTRKAKLLFVNGFWASFDCENRLSSEPLEKLILSWHDADKCLKVLVKA
jgi:schlafen family protein